MLSRHAVTDTRTPISDDLRAVIEILQRRVWPANTTAMEGQILTDLTPCGFVGSGECRHQYGARRGRVDLIVERSGSPIAIEIDNKSPRHRTVAKLRAFEGERLIVLKVGKSARPAQVRGIHRVLGVTVSL